MIDFADIRGQEVAKRAMTIALAGKHGIALVGPRGCGKTMLIEAARGLDERLKATELHAHHPHFREHAEITAAVMDIHVELSPVPFADLFGKRRGTDTAAVRQCCDAARGFLVDHTLTMDLSHICLPLLKQAANDLGLSARALMAVVRVARTISDIDCDVAISPSAVAEAVQYRLLDRKY